MARGDVVSDVVSINASSTTDVQPASGVEWLIKSFGSNGNSTSQIRYYDGSNNAWIVDASQSAPNGGECTAIFTNANYMRLQNTHSGGAVVFGYAGYITKD
jgi:hypothetical protein